MNDDANPPPPDDPAYRAFAADARARGFDQVLVREWRPGQVLDEHRHDFALEVRVVRGEVALGVAGAPPVRYAAGEGFSLDAGMPHSERYGPEGATFWVARRHPPAAG